MSLIKFKNPNALSTPFDALINDFFEGEFFPNRAQLNRVVPAANIKETETGFHVELAAPGMTKEDFKIELDENLLTIRTERKTENEETKGKYTKREFNYSSFVRSFRLPEEVDAENIGAKYQDGILLLEIPKKEVEQKEKVRRIEIK